MLLFEMFYYIQCVIHCNYDTVYCIVYPETVNKSYTMLYCLLHVQSHHVCDSAQSDGKATEQCTVVGKEAIAARNIYSKAML